MVWGRHHAVMKAVIHLTSNAADDVDFALACASVLGRIEPSGIEVVSLSIHRDGIRLVTPNSPRRNEVSELVDRDITILAGGTCFDARDLPREVVPGVELVESGDTELLRLQSVGYRYAKVP